MLFTGMTKNLQAKIPYSCSDRDHCRRRDAAPVDHGRLSLALHMHVRRKCAENSQFANIVLSAE
jgi:hypothetical protein